MHRHMDDSLNAIRQRLITMSALAERMVEESIHLLIHQEAALIPRIHDHESKVNALQVEIDELCLDTIALHQPAAKDLRFILGATKSNADLERLADQAINITEKAEEVLGEKALPFLPELQQMADLAREQLRNSLHAFVNGDTRKAKGVLVRDDELDAMKSHLTDQLIQQLSADSQHTRADVDLLLIARNLERIGDHATNIAENTIFVVEGRDVRHHREDDSD